MQAMSSRIVVEGLVYPEGIRWHDGRVWFSDVLAFRVCAYDPESGRTEVVVQLEDRPSGLGFLPDGRLLIATMGARTVLRLDPGGLAVHSDLSGLCALLNDMVVDSRGRAYVGGYFTANATSGAVFLIEPDGRLRLVADGMQAPNGMAVTPDGKTLVVNDLFANHILAFDIAEDGGLENRRIFAELGGASPDGLCLDAEGAAWVGQPFQNRFRRILQGGQVTHELACERGWGIAPVLGGPDRRTLYLCTADVTLGEIQRLMHDPHAPDPQCRGWIEAADGAPAAGAGWP